MSRPSDLPPSSLSPHPSSDPLSPFFFAGFLRLLYWTFFKPSGFQDYTRRLLGEDADKEGLRPFLAALKHPHTRRFMLKSLFLTVAVTALTSATINVAFNPEGVDVPRVAFGVAFGVAAGVAGGVAFGVAGGVAFGVAVGVAFGVAGGVAFGVAGGVAAIAGFLRLPIY